MLVALLAGFCCGVMLYFLGALTLPVVNAPYSIVNISGVSLCIFLSSVILCSWCKYYPQYRRTSPCFCIAITVGALWAALAWGAYSEQKIMEPTAVFWKGEVVGLPEVRDGRVRFLFERVSATPNPDESLRSLVWPELPLKVDWYSPAVEIEPGQIWSLPMTVRPSEALYLSGVAKVTLSGQPPILEGSRWNYHVPRYALKSRLLDSGVNTAAPASPLLLALLLGDRSLLTKSDWQLFGDTGTSHLIAISGLHVGLVASFAYFMSLQLLRLFQRFYWGLRSRLSERLNQRPSLLKGRQRKERRFSFNVVDFQIAYLVALGAAWIYGAMAGYSVPTQRACLMATVIVLWRLIYPVARSWVALLVSAAVVLLLDPITAMTASFWLSFVAVLLIFMVLQGRVGRLNIVQSWLRVQLALFFGLMPLSLWYFGKVALLSAFANLVAVPLVGWLIVPLSFLYSALILSCDLASEPPNSLIMTATHWVFALIDVLVVALFTLLKTLQSYDAVLYFPKPSALSVFLAMFAVCILCLPRAVPAKWLVGLMFLPLFASTVRTESDQQMEYLPSGQLLMMLDLGSELFLVGSKYQTAAWVQSRFERFLQLKGLKNELPEPVLSLYRQWTSAEYFMLRIKLESRPLLQWAATEIEVLPICREEKFSVRGIEVESLIGAKDVSCQVLLAADWGRYLLINAKTVDDQLRFLGKNEEALSRSAIEGLLVSGTKPLTGALLNTINSGEVALWGRESLDQQTQQRLLTRGIRATLL